MRGEEKTCMVTKCLNIKLFRHLNIFYPGHTTDKKGVKIVKMIAEYMQMPPFSYVILIQIPKMGCMNTISMDEGRRRITKLVYRTSAPIRACK